MRHRSRLMAHPPSSDNPALGQTGDERPTTRCSAGLSCCFKSRRWAGLVNHAFILKVFPSIAPLPKLFSMQGNVLK